MSKALSAVLVAVLALACLASAGLVGFVGYRALRRQPQPAAQSPVQTGTRAVLPGPVEAEQSPEADEGTPASAPPEVPEVPPGATPTGAATRQEGSTGSRGSAEVPEGSGAQQPPRRPRPLPEEGPRGTRRSDGKPTDEERPAPVKGRGRGVLGLVFESRIDRGDMVFRVDGRLVERVPFTASAQGRYRYTRQVPLAAGVHRVRIRVDIPGEAHQMQDWTVTVPEGGSTVWKVQLDRFPKVLEVKKVS